LSLVQIRLDPISSEVEHPKHGHLEVSKCEVDCLLAISKMKVEGSSTRLNDDLCSIYNDSITYLTTVEKHLYFIIHVRYYIVSYYTIPYNRAKKCLKLVQVSGTYRKTLLLSPYVNKEPYFK
jgi:hypothetical protein